MQKVLVFEEKVFTSWIQTCGLLNASQLLYPSSYMAVVFNGMLLKFFSTSSFSARCRTQADHHITLRYEVGG